ncbi:MAG: putative secondary metabolism biosynthetic enzyme [Candelaria pacifica]|nr:MAG: putative secondary metabolism biosynthetic enzyme [Candelaria pacifica]
MKVLITGGAGFLGAHLVDLLLSKGHTVLVLDSFWTATPKSLQKHLSNPCFSLREFDVTNPWPEDISVDQIYHLACPASPKRFPENPSKILDTCYLGTSHALDLARRTNARLLLASTSEVYGDALVCPQSESYWGNVNSFGYRSCYDEGKRVAEALCYAYRRQHNVDVRIVRIFNTYGPGLLPNDGRVVSNFIASILDGKNVTVQGDGKASRCFQYVTDCVRGMYLLMESDWEGPVNIGTQRETTIGELAEIIIRMVKEKTGGEGDISKIGINYVAKTEDDPFRRVPDCRTALKVLGWKPEMELEDGLERTIEWHLGLRREKEVTNQTNRK